MEKIIFNIYLILLVFTLTSSQDDIIFSKESGFYTEEFLLTLSTSSETLKIFYTTDGSDQLIQLHQKNIESLFKL